MFVCQNVALAQTPNILFIMADDLGWADLSTPLTTLGDPSDFYETPAIDALAAQGMAFTNAYASPTCAATRAAILSGAYAPRDTNNVYQVGSLNPSITDTLLLGVDQGTTGNNDKLPAATITFAETLQTAGYTTGTVGKFHVASNPSQILTRHGFDENYGGSSSGGPGEYHATNGTFGNSIDASLDPYAADYTQDYVDTFLKPYAQGASTAALDALVGTPKHLTDASADAAIDFLSSHNDDPFFLQFNAHAPHTPIDDAQARADLLDKYQQKTPGLEDSDASYAALIEGFDQSVARLIDYLQTTPDPRIPGQTLDQNTLVLVYSDNGGQSPQANVSNLSGSKGQLDEGGIRVPLIAWSGNDELVDAGTINDSVVMPIDWYPTFASLADAALPNSQSIDGVDLSATLADVNADLDRNQVYWHLPGYAQGRSGQTPQTAVRSGDWKLLYNYEDQTYELYNLAEDPSESVDLSAQEPLLVNQLAFDLLQWLDEVDAPLATLREGTLDVFIDGTSFANGVITQHEAQTITIVAGQEVPLIVSALPELLGDYNNTGSVEQGDLDLVLNNWGDPRGEWTNADGFSSANVDQEELDRVLNHWGDRLAPSFSNSSTNPVPEPGVAASLLILLAAATRRGHSRAACASTQICRNITN